jgi:hypothetical protein
VLEDYLTDGSPAVEAWTLSALGFADGDVAPVRDRAQLLLGQADSWPSSSGSS